MSDPAPHTATASAHQEATFAGGCFWCLEAAFNRLTGVLSAESGYSNGAHPSPDYESVCTGRTGHAEVVRVRFDPARIGYPQLLEVFFFLHDPTTLNRQGNDVGTQYRSGIYTTTPEQLAVAQASRALYQDALSAAHKGEIATEIVPLRKFYYEGDTIHQQYLHKNPSGYCGLGGTGVSCPVGVGISAD